MGGVLCTRVTREADDDLQSSVALRNRECPCRPCNGRRGVHVNVPLLGGEAREVPQQAGGCAQIEAGRTTQLEVRVDSLHQHGESSKGQGCATLRSAGTSTLA